MLSTSIFNRIYLQPLCLDLFTYKMEILIVPISQDGYFEDYIVSKCQLCQQCLANSLVLSEYQQLSDSLLLCHYCLCIITVLYLRSVSTSSYTYTHILLSSQHTIFRMPLFSCFLLHLSCLRCQSKKLACYFFMDCARRHENPRSGAKDFITAQ